MILELDALDPGSHGFRYPVNTGGEGSVQSHLTFSVVEFSRKMNAILDLLDATTDALAATWDMHTEAMVAETDVYPGSDFEPPVQ